MRAVASLRSAYCEEHRCPRWCIHGETIIESSTERPPGFPAMSKSPDAGFMTLPVNLLPIPSSSSVVASRQTTHPSSRHLRYPAQCNSGPGSTRTLPAGHHLVLISTQSINSIRRMIPGVIASRLDPANKVTSTRSVNSSEALGQTSSDLAKFLLLEADLQYCRGPRLVSTEKFI